MSKIPPEIIAASERLARQRARRAQQTSTAPTFAGLRLVRPPEHVLEANEAELAKIEATRAKRQAEADEAARLAKRRRILEGSGLRLPPEDIARLVRGREGETATLGKVQAWFAALREPGAKRCAVLLGTVGTGKTMAAGWALLTMGDGLATKARRLIALEAARWGEAAEAYQALVDAPLAIVDEIGKGKAEDEAAAVGELVDDRIGRPTMLIGNMGPEAFQKRYDLRLLSRLHKVGEIMDCRGDDLRVTGESMRRRDRG